MTSEKGRKGELTGAIEIEPMQGIQAIDLNDFEDFRKQLTKRIEKASR